MRLRPVHQRVSVSLFGPLAQKFKISIQHTDEGSRSSGIQGLGPLARQVDLDDRERLATKQDSVGLDGAFAGKAVVS